VTEGVDNQFKSIGNLELGKNRAEVVSNRRLADEKSFGDLLVL